MSDSERERERTRARARTEKKIEYSCAERGVDWGEGWRWDDKKYEKKLKCHVMMQ